MADRNSKLNQLKKKLAEELAKTLSDSNVILGLSNEIAQLDQDQIRFTVDAGIINRLGKELVGRHETAVSELVKNAYDADASEVKLTFENAWQAGGTLHIEDTGTGMTWEQLVSGFMRLSSSDKIHNPVSPRYNRVRAGRKGIGRFATQRLGERLTIITQTLESNEALQLDIDWNAFKADVDLLFVTNSILSIPKKKEEGTDLIIHGLREGWTDAMIKRVYRYTSDLLQPFPLSKEINDQGQTPAIQHKTGNQRVDPGFRSAYYRISDTERTLITNEELAFFDHALAEIEGYVLDDGQACWSLKSEKLGVPEEVFLIGKEREDENSKFSYIKGVHFKAYYFIYLPALIPSKQLSFIREVANDRGGIRMYRNGFRVLPYGETGNDWLRLDESSRRRVVLTPHANNNFFGFVQITDETGILYEETSSREGLIQNEAFNELVDFIYRSLVTATRKIADLRGTKQVTSQKDWRKDSNSATNIVDSAISDIENLVGNVTSEEELVGLPEKVKEIVLRLLIGRAREKEETENFLEEVNMLRVLAGLGLVVGEFIHEVKRFLPAFHTDTTYLKNLLKSNVEAMNRTERLSENLKSFTTYTAYFDNTISQNVTRELESIELRDVVYAFKQVIARDTQRSNILFDQPKFDDFDLFTVPMHKSEWASILFNLYTNSKKAIRRAGKGPGRVYIHCGRNEGYVFLEFSDDGDGIPVENRNRVFDAFFTTTSAANLSTADVDALSGTGLGLKIVRDIVESYGGEILVSEPIEDFATTIKMLIPSK